MIERPVADLLKFQRLDLATSLWEDFTGILTGVNVRRGGVSAVDVGTLDASLEVDEDPLQQGVLKPNQSVRLVMASTEVPVFTGTILDVDVQRVRDAAVQAERLVATVTCVDAVAVLGSRTRYGAVTSGGAGFESWANRIIRLAASSPTDVELPEDDSPIVIYSI